MSQFISVQIQSKAVIDIDNSEVVSRKLRNSNQVGFNLQAANIIDKYVLSQKNRIHQECMRKIDGDWVKVKSKLVSYAKNPLSEIEKVFQFVGKSKEPLLLSRCLHKVIDVRQKYQKPISQKLGVVEEVADIERYKQFKKSVISSKHKSENSPNCRQMKFLLRRTMKPHKKGKNKFSSSMVSPVVEERRTSYARSTHPSYHSVNSSFRF